MKYRSNPIFSCNPSRFPCRTRLTALFLASVAGSLVLGLQMSARFASADEPAVSQAEQSQAEEKKPSEANSDQAWEVGKWYKLFDGKTLEGWKSTQFGGEGEVRVEQDQQELVI